MPKLTDKERERRRRKVQEAALEAVAARGQFNFRLEGKNIKRLYELAGQRQKPVSALVREWVLERLEIEETGKPSAPLWAQELEQRLSHTEVLIALATLSASQNSRDKTLRLKIYDHVLKHCNIENDDDLRGLLHLQ